MTENQNEGQPDVPVVDRPEEDPDYVEPKHDVEEFTTEGKTIDFVGVEVSDEVPD